MGPTIGRLSIGIMVDITWLPPAVGIATRAAEEAEVGIPIIMGDGEEDVDEAAAAAAAASGEMTPIDLCKCCCCC